MLATVFFHLQCITCVKMLHQSKSFEEMRYEDYAANRKGNVTREIEDSTRAPFGSTFINQNIVRPSKFTAVALFGTSIKFNPPVASTINLIPDNGTEDSEFAHMQSDYPSKLIMRSRLQCISCMKEYQNKSLEELRLEDYFANRKGKVTTSTGITSPIISFNRTFLKAKKAKMKAKSTTRKEVRKSTASLSNSKKNNTPDSLQIILINLLADVKCLIDGGQKSDMSKDTVSRCEDRNINFKLSTLLPILKSPRRKLQFASHSLICSIIPPVASLLAKTETPVNEDDDIEDNIVKIPDWLSPLIEHLNSINEKLESALSPIGIDYSCTVSPCTEPDVFTRAYLFGWLEMFEFISSSPSQVRAGYTAHLEETSMLSSMFSNVFRLMPGIRKFYSKNAFNSYTLKTESLEVLFFQLPTEPDESEDSSSSEEFENLACYTFVTAMRKVPASLRTWWYHLDKSAADTVHSFISTYISEILSNKEIQAVRDNEKNFENMMVRSNPKSREITVTYTIDNTDIELNVQLPANYPLGPASVEKKGANLFPQQEWGHWLMQLTNILTYQNGSILDGLTTWKKNLDKKFEGEEECMICYYIFHGSTLKLPNRSCYTCKKKFHTPCLNKWFDTSNKSTCPLCRNKFSV